MSEETNNYAKWLREGGFVLVRQNGEQAWDVVRSVWQAVGLEAGAIPTDAEYRAQWLERWHTLYALCDAVPLWRDSASPCGSTPETQALAVRLAGGGESFWLWEIGYRSPVVYKAAFSDLDHVIEKLRECPADALICSAQFDAVAIIPHWNAVHLWIAGMPSSVSEE